jgi:phosphomevalonate kinase
MRELGKLSGAPIEPDEMGRLIQGVIETVEGVVGGGVPGAGGYDALYILYISEKTAAASRAGEIEKTLMAAKEKGLSVGVLLSRSGGAKGHQGKSETRRGGLRLEDVSDVRGLSEAVGG